ncbi:alpha/beta hydrolase [Pseudoxanthomonas sp.]|uniref:alpha/beta hydrolase n=1 Tax=Pseudoxanthomonas sp. TaxID=1871049 RepID=UPI00260FB165|nr:alpha/beta hydrolase [Pseudoxanthomonas sp.]WDS38060.1 MAG: alpha/beta hydrolase [Pseudoxanthomonas sp.]
MRWLAVILALVVLGYVALCALVYVKQRSLIFYPQYTQVAPRSDDLQLKRDGLVLRGRVLNPGQSRALLYFGGNAERVQDSADELARSFPSHTIYLLAYRGYGASGGVPSQDALFGDAVALYDHVRQQQPDAPVDVIGRSLGSGVASWVAGQRPVPHLALVTPFDSLVHVGQLHYPWLPTGWLMRECFDSAKHLATHHGDTLVLRAGRDTVVPPAATAALIASLPADRLQVVAFAHYDHITISAAPDYWPAMARFMGSTVARPAP